jgi:hypothetical protein
VKLWKRHQCPPCREWHWTPLPAEHIPAAWPNGDILDDQHKGVEIILGETGSDPENRILVDGHDISRYVTSVAVDSAPCEFAKATVRLEIASLRARVDGLQLHSDIAAALIALGWTPPKDT